MVSEPNGWKWTNPYSKRNEYRASNYNFKHNLLQLRDMINTAATDSDNSGTKDVSAFIFYDGSNYMLALKVNMEVQMK